jgi:hypothetical protein
VFRLRPTFAVLPTKAAGGNGHYQYLNLRGFQRPRGLGLGGGATCDDRSFRLWLPEEDLDACRCRRSCNTFEPGPLSRAAERRGQVVGVLWVGLLCGLACAFHLAHVRARAHSLWKGH